MFEIFMSEQNYYIKYLILATWYSTVQQLKVFDFTIEKITTFS